MRTTLLTICLLALAAAPAAQASSTMRTLFQDDGRILRSGEAAREAALDEIAAEGAEVLKLHVVWADVAPGGATKPEGFSGHELSSYSEAAFAPYDAAIRGAKARGLDVLLAPTPPAPGWATAERGDERGVYRPSAREYGRFVRALATRYDGNHGLPRVTMWTFGNEPNHPDFLQPLGSRRGTYIAPHLYREMVRHGLAGLRLAGHAKDTILFGETLPIGKRRPGPRNTISPVTFIREFFCLDRRWRPYRGRAARIRDCDGFKRISGLSGYAHHPYTRPGGPRTRETSREDAQIQSLSRITKALDRAAARRRLAGRRMRVYITEFGFQSDPPDRFWTPIARIPAYLSESEWIAWRNRRVATWSQYALVDDVALSGFQSGLRFADGSEKPGVYDAYRRPFFVRLRGSRSVEVWGGVRAGGRGDVVEVQQRLGRRGEWRKLRTLRLNARGYFRATIRISRADDREYRFVAGTAASREARASRR
jgi:hypothetical protein